MLLFTTLQAQNKDSINLTEIETPATPAFTLLDQAPTLIAKPNSGKAFMTSIENSFQNSNNGVPQNYAVEFTPFWFFNHPKMTALKFMGYDPVNDKQLVFNGLSKATVSFAYVNTLGKDSITNSAKANYSIGLSFNIISIRSGQEITNLKKANLEMVEYLKNLNQQEKDAGINDSLAVADLDQYHKKMKAFLATHEKDSVGARNEMQNVLKQNPVFSLDGASGYSTFFPNDNYSSNHFGRFGAWLTANLAFGIGKSSDGNPNYLNLYAVGRYIIDGTTGTTITYRDFGGKVESAFEKITFSYEYIYRADNANTNTFRSTGLIKYKVSNSICIVGSFGKNFGDVNNIISMLGINWGLSTNTQNAKLQ